LFRRLAVFAGGFTLDAVRDVAGRIGDRSADSDPLPLLGRLVDQSLVTVRKTGTDVRYRLLDTIRQYAEDQLVAAGETTVVRDRHLDHYLQLAEQAEPGLDTDQDVWRVRLDSHRSNFGVALEWGLADDGPADDSRSEHGRRLAAALARQWFVRGQASEGLRWLQRAIDVEPSARTRVQARLVTGTALLGMISGRITLVAERAEQGLELAGESGDGVSAARCLAVSSYPLFFVDFEQCHEVGMQARVAADQVSDAFARDLAGLVAGYSLQTRNRLAECTALARDVYAGSAPRGDRFCAAFGRGIEIFVALVSGDVDGAAEIGEEVVDLVSPLGDYFAVGTNTCNAALAIAMSGDLGRARKLMDPIVRSVDTAADVDVVGFMVVYGLLHLWDGDLEGAVEWFEVGVRRMEEDRQDWTAARCLPGLVQALRRLGRTDEAKELASRAVTIETEFEAPYELTNVLDEQGRLVALDDPVRGRDILLEALTVRRTHGLRTGYADTLDALSEHEANRGDPIEATRLAALSARSRGRMGYPVPPVDRLRVEALVESLRERVGETFDTVWDEGAARDLDDVVAALTRGRGPRNRPAVGWDSLTPTEREVVALVADGMTNPEIAARLYMSRSTVKTHLAHVYAKVGVANRTELARQAGGRSPD
jgi:DNA-binding CsgD family transcriptional regulator/tetratricopeptide (TPR) repeat protein